MMFTYDQGLELVNNTDSEWTTINGITGRKITNKTDYSKYIFISVAGFWSDTNNTTIDRFGYYFLTIFLNKN